MQQLIRWVTGLLLGSGVLLLPPVWAQETVLEVSGRLEKTDNTLKDGSFYDAYELTGKAGETFAILLESIDFDPYLLVWDDQGQKIAENDDLARAEGNYQAGLVLTLPKTGTYRILANSVGSGRRGAYRLQGVRGDQIPALGERAQRQTLGNRLNRQGSQQFKVSQFREALQSWEQALAIYREIGDRAGEGAALGNLGSAYLNLGQYPRAIELYEQQLVITREIGDRAGEARAIHNLAVVYKTLENYDQAIQYYQQSLVLIRELQEQDFEGRALSNLGELLNLQDQPELAIIFYKQSINLREEIRSDLRTLSPDLQQSYTDTVAASYRTLADLLLQQGRIVEALRVLDLLKVQELDEYLDGVRSSEDSRRGVSSLPPETAIAALHSDLVDRAITNGRELRQLEQPGIPLTPEELQRLDQLQAEEDVLVQAFFGFVKSPEVQQRLAELRVKDPEELKRNLSLDHLSDLQDNLARMNQDAVLLYPLVLDDRLELILVTPNTPPIRRTSPISRADLNRLVGQLRYALEAPGREAKAPAQELYDLLLRPFAADLKAAGAKTLIYAPDRALRYVPLATLHDGQQWLAETYRIHNITAASLDDLDNPPSDQPSILAGAFTQGQHTITVGEQVYPFTGLAQTARELDRLASLVSANQFTGYRDQDFSPAAIRQQANRHTIIHLATHAQFEPGPPEHSFILFGNGEIKTLTDLDGGWLTLRNADLVVLSACETALDSAVSQEGAEILGLGYVLQQKAGARATLASLWKVDDGGTQALMERFYDALLRGRLSKAAALREAQLSFIQAAEQSQRGFEVVYNTNGEAIDPSDLSHPYYWAPFILIGNGL